MLNVEQIEGWLGEDVVDAAGERVGKLEEVFYSTATGEATFASVKSGLLGRHADVVPLAGGSVGRDYVRLAYSKLEIDRANSDVSVRDSLDRDSARKLGESYAVEIAQGDDFESATIVNARREEAAEARSRAEALEQEAQQRAADAQEAQGTAHSAQQDAAERAAESERARADAEQARKDAERIAGS